jgi:glycosyltransferase involved in cell wall biosynthesis
LKVLLISHYPPPSGGIASWTKRLLKLGLPDGWEIDHVNSNTINGRDPFQNVKRSLKDEWYRSRNIWKQEKVFLKEDEEVEVVHTCIPCTVFGMIRETVTGLIAKKYKKKFILHCRCTVPNVVDSGFKRFFFKILSHYCDGIIVLNKKSEEFAKKYSKAKVILIPNFVTEDELIDGNNTEIRDKVKEVIYVGGVTPEKGCDTIIKAAKSLPRMNFHLIGIVSAEIEAMNIPDNVILHGNHDKDYVKEQLPKGDVFLFLSRYWGEGFSNALVEAMAAGLPCIVTDWAANADMIEESGGKIIPQNDVDALISALEGYENDKEARASASKWNVKKVKDTYISDIVLKQYTDFYSELLN